MNYSPYQHIDPLRSSAHDRPKPIPRSATAHPRLTAGTSTTSALESSSSSQLRNTTSKDRRSHNPLSHRYQHRDGSHSHHHHQFRDTVQSAVQQYAPSSFTDLLKQQSRTSNNGSGAASGSEAGTDRDTSSQPRRGSAQPNNSTTPNNSNSSAGGNARDAARPGTLGRTTSPTPQSQSQSQGSRPRLIRLEDVARERLKAKRRDEELRQSLHTLSEQAHQATRKVDDVYYSILEEVSVLRSTVSGLQELDLLVKKVGGEFEADAAGLQEEVEGQIEGFGGFEGQKRRIGELEGRVRRSRERAGRLSERLEKARGRVEMFGRREMEWEAATSRNLKILWGILGTVLGIVLVVLVIRCVSEGDGNGGGVMVQRRWKDIKDAPVPESVKEILENIHTRTGAMPRHFTTSVTQYRPEEDPVLRKLDEL